MCGATRSSNLFLRACGRPPAATVPADLDKSDELPGRPAPPCAYLVDQFEPVLGVPLLTDLLEAVLGAAGHIERTGYSKPDMRRDRRANDRG
jgi:hypothetical protein